jgi:nucleoside-diphosphate-sugar epimerase
VLLSGSPGQAYNVGASGPEVSILELARLVARVAGEGSQVVFAGEDEAGAGSPARTCPDIAKIQGELGWTPSTSLEEGLRRTLAWLKEEER